LAPTDPFTFWVLQSGAPKGIERANTTFVSIAAEFLDDALNLFPQFDLALARDDHPRGVAVRIDIGGDVVSKPAARSSRPAASARSIPCQLSQLRKMSSATKKLAFAFPMLI
jgi:hypothetical protein